MCSTQPCIALPKPPARPRWVVACLALVAASALCCTNPAPLSEPQPPPQSPQPPPLGPQPAAPDPTLQRGPMADLWQLMDACLPLTKPMAQLEIPALFYCFEKVLTALDFIVENSSGGADAEIWLALRYQAEEMVATLVSWGQNGTGPALSAKATAQLVSEGGPLVLRFALLGKSRGLDVALLRSLQAAHAERTSPYRADLNALVQEYLFHDWRGPMGEARIRHEQKLQEFRDRIHVTEDHIGALVKNSQQRSIPHPNDLMRAVAGQLPPGSALLEIVEFRPLKKNSPDPELFFKPTQDVIIRMLTQTVQRQRPTVSSPTSLDFWEAPHYLAVVLFPDQRIFTHDLGEVKTIDREVAALYERLSRNTKNSAVPPAQAVYRMVFLPLLEALGKTRTVYLALDGNLHSIPFDALHDGKRYLIDSYDFFYLNSGRDLLRSPTAQPGGPPLILAAARFGQTPHSVPPAAPPPGLYAQVQSAPALDHVDQEAADIAAQLKGARLLRGGAGTELALRQQLQQGPSPRILHIAAHGVFLVGRGSAGSPLGDTRSALSRIGPEASFGPPAAPPPAALPVHAPGEDLLPALSRAALILSDGAIPSTAAEVDRDGILTALEVRSLQLQQTQLAVLSACETGTGARTISQGVYGFRLAFALAGVESLVMSLWRVNDQTTRELMRTYYQKLARGTPRLTALHESMQALKKNYHEPFYWAPFVGIGRDAPVSP